MEQEEIKKAVAGKPYFIYDDDGGELYLPAMNMADFWDVYKTWENFHYFGLPPSVDWRDNEVLFLDLLKIGQKAWESSENWKIKNANKPRIDK